MLTEVNSLRRDQAWSRSVTKVKGQGCGQFHSDRDLWQALDYLPPSRVHFDRKKIVLEPSSIKSKQTIYEKNALKKVCHKNAI